MTITYTCQGNVRGACGVKHRTIATAARCVQHDRQVCHALGGGSYSDRHVHALIGGRAEPLSPADQEVCDDLELEAAAS